MHYNSMNIHGVVSVAVKKWESEDFDAIEVKVVADDGNEFTLSLFRSSTVDNIDVDVKRL